MLCQTILLDGKTKNGSSTPISRVLFSLARKRASVIYLDCESPHSSSILPSIVALRHRTDSPRTMVYANLQHPVCTAQRSPVGWWSLTPPSHPYRTIGAAVVLFYVHLLSPTASIFRSELSCAARTFLLTSICQATEPEYCFRHAKLIKNSGILHLITAKVSEQRQRAVNLSVAALLRITVFSKQLEPFGFS